MTLTSRCSSPIQFQSSTRIASTASARRGPTTSRRVVGLDADDVERLGLAADLDPAALADGEMDDAAMLPEHAAVEVDDVAGGRGLGPQLLDQAGIVAVGDEADVLAVGLGGDAEARVLGEPPDLALGQVAEREAQIIELLARGAVEEIALVAIRVGGACNSARPSLDDPPHIMAGREAVGAKLAREGDQIGELHPLVAQAQGTGVRPRAYSSAKRSITPVRKRLS